MILSVVATPIGNLKDISLRAKEVLEQATLIIAEDTRTTGQLFKLLGIGGEHEFISSHAQSSEKEFEKVLSRCVDHEHIALVTDAGTPAISDPGSLFVNLFRERYPDAVIVPIPGPSALIAALSVCGYPTNHFEFVGFIPHKKGRQTLFAQISQREHAVVCYESPHRILKTLEALMELIPNRKAFVAREMTKVFEEYRSDTIAAQYDYYKTHPEKCRGEFVIILAPANYH